MLSNKFKQFPTDKLFVVREGRQRTEIDVEELIPSIERRGIYNPLIIKDSGEIIAGERRWTAAKKLNLPTVPVRFAGDLSDRELQMVELEENLRRKDLPWQDQVNAIARLHELYLTEHPDATQKDFADYTGFHDSFIGKVLMAKKAMTEGHARVSEAPTLRKAIRVVQRQKEREEQNMMAEIIDTLGGNSKAPPIEHEPEEILHTSFHDWSTEYSGPKFNLIHCDFPYGVNLQDSDQLQAGGSAHQTYEDSEEVYWKLLDTLALQQDAFISSSAHMIFWFHPNYYCETRAFFAARMPDWQFDEVPLVWLKSDNKGIAPDVERRPRRVTEFAFFGWRGDRKIEKLFSNGYAAPKADSSHVSEKPEPVLRHFFGGLVGPHTRLFDPTCGSGSSLRAAFSLGAASILGLEIDESYAATAREKLKVAKALKAFAEG